MARTREGAYVRLWEDVAGDTKLDQLTAEEFRVFVRLLALSAREDGSFYLDEATVVLSCRGDVALLGRTIARLEDLEVLVSSGIQAWSFVNWEKRNKVAPSDTPEAVAKRMAASRERRKSRANGVQGSEVMVSSYVLQGKVTRNSPRADDVVDRVLVVSTPETEGETTGGSGGSGGPIQRTAQTGPTMPHHAAPLASPQPRSAPEGADRVSNGHPTRSSALEGRTTGDVTRNTVMASSYALPPNGVTCNTVMASSYAIPPSVMASSYVSQESPPENTVQAARTPEESEVIATLTAIDQSKGRFGEDRGDLDTERLRKIARKFPGVSLSFVASNYAETTLSQPPTWPRFEMWVKDEAGKLAARTAPTPTGEIAAFRTRSRSYASNPRGAKT